jgi:hypothetical protein
MGLGVREGDLLVMMVRRAQIVGAAIDAAQGASTRSVWVTAFAVAGLVTVGACSRRTSRSPASMFVRATTLRSQMRVANRAGSGIS